MKRPLEPAVLLLAACLLFSLAACGSGSSPVPQEPFDTGYPTDPVGPPPGDNPVPPPEPPKQPVFTSDAYVHSRVVLYGAFPSDVVRHGDTVFTTDADEIGLEGATILAFDVSGPFPVDSARYQPVTIRAEDLRDSNGRAGDAANPIGFGFFLNDLEIVGDHLGFVLVGAAGSDSLPQLSNLVAFDPTTGAVLQVVNLANTYPTQLGATDSSGLLVPARGFAQSGAEALEYVAWGRGRDRLYVAMTNLIFNPPSSGTVKYPGTVQVFDVDPSAATPVSAISASGLVTETLDVGGYNPVALLAFGGSSLPLDPAPRLLVTVAGATAYDASFNLVPATPASVATFAGDTGTYLGRFRLGLAGLSATRPAVGRDAAGHRVAFFPSAVTGEVYLLRLDGLDASPVDDSRLAVLRGPANGIPIRTDSAGGPGAHLASVGLAPDGRTLVVAGFGDLFASPEPIPGRLYLLGLPEDLITGSGFGVDFVPGATLYGTAPGRTLGALALLPNSGARPDVYVAVSSPLDKWTFLATGPASLGTLQTFGLIR